MISLASPVAKMSFLHRVAGLSVRNKMRSSVIREEPRVELLLLNIKRLNIRLPPGHLPNEVFWPYPTGRKIQDMLKRLTGLGNSADPPEKLDEVAKEWKSGFPCLDYCPCDPTLAKPS